MPPPRLDQPMPDAAAPSSAAADFARHLGDAWLREMPADLRARLSARDRKLVAKVAEDAAAVHAEIGVAAAANAVTPELEEAMKQVKAQVAGLAVSLRADVRGSFAAAWLKTVESARTLARRFVMSLLVA